MQQRGADAGALDPQAHSRIEIAEHDAVADDLGARFEAVGQFDFDDAVGRHHDRPV